MSRKDYGIHRVPVPGTTITGVAVLLLVATVLVGLAPIRWFMLAALAIGMLVAGALILMRRRSRRAPAAARLIFPADPK